MALEIDGTWASQRRPGVSTTASVWDVLCLPLLLRPEWRRPRVLVLGLGGGSAARVVRAVSPQARMVGVELDAEVIRVARREFGLHELGLELRCEDAGETLRRSRRRFDFIIEDVFVGSGNTPRKPPGFPDPGLRDAARRIAPEGILVSNALDEASAVRGLQTELWPHVLELRLDGFDNRIVAGSRGALDARTLRRAVARHPILRECLGGLRVRKLAP